MQSPVHIKARYVLLWFIPAVLIGLLPMAVISPEWFADAGARYRTLWAPIIVHVANNALAVGATAIVAHAGIAETATVEELRAQWWVPLAGAAVMLPRLLQLRKLWVPIADWRFEPAAAAG